MSHTGAYYYVLRYSGIRTSGWDDERMEAELFEWGRFTEPALFILGSLASDPKHDYSILERIAAFAGG